MSVDLEIVLFHLTTTWAELNWTELTSSVLQIILILYKTLAKVQVNKGKLYSKPCLDTQQILSDKGHITEKAHYTDTTSIDNKHLLLSIKHDVQTTREKIAK